MFSDGALGQLESIEMGDDRKDSAVFLQGPFRGANIPVSEGSSKMLLDCGGVIRGGKNPLPPEFGDYMAVYEDAGEVTTRVYRCTGFQHKTTKEIVDKIPKPNQGSKE